MTEPTAPISPMFVDPRPAVGSMSVPTKKTKTAKKWWLVAGVLVVVLAMILAMSSYAWAVYRPAGPSGEMVAVTIQPGSSVEQITDVLVEKKLVSHPLMFALYLKLSGQGQQLQAGDFSIPQHISMQDLVGKLGVASHDQATLRFAEGWRREEMADYIDQQHQSGALAGMTGAQFSELALNPSPALRAKLGSALPADASLQGFLFPDTYQVDQNDTAEELIVRMLDNYRSKATPAMVAAWKSEGLTEYEALNLAAIVEREARAGAEERAVIAGILLKRLDNGIPLGVDATLQYALGYSDSEKRWWRRNITVDDLALETPYNTRKVAGLPPRPISNPGLEAMVAASKPESSAYLYYIHGTDGQVHYARTQAEHDANIAKYLR